MTYPTGKPGHTPGPWVADFSSDAVRVRAPDNSGVCTLNWLSAKGRRSGNEGEANARLIAAAPELLAGCKALVGMIQLVCARDDIPLVIRDALLTNHRLDEAQAAVTKAEGPS